MSSSPETTLKPIAFWQLNKNPILRRYLRSRMRWVGLSSTLILTLVITIFTYLLTYYGAGKLDEITTQEAYRATFLPIFILQIIIMMFLGTGAVVSGTIQEFEDGMIDYQRLTPMTPMAKIVGYLFGLPIREWFLLGVTSIAIGITVVKGNIPFSSIWPVYSVFFFSILMYHLMALVVVQSMKLKRGAGRVIQILVLLLYIAFPMLSRFGLVFFEYLTVRPILKDHMLEYLPKTSGLVSILNVDKTNVSVPFFDQYLDAWNFSMIMQISLIIIFVVMLRRRWHDAASHLISKPLAVLFYGFFIFMLIGNALPIAEKGNMSIRRTEQLKQIETMEAHLQKTGLSAEGRREVQAALESAQHRKALYAPVEQAITQTIFFTICFMLACVICYICTPTHSKYLVGLRRARNMKKKWLPLHWDEASGYIVVICIAAILAVALSIFSKTLYSAPDIPISLKALIPFLPTATGYAVLSLVCFYLVYEAWENRGIFLFILFIWILPMMVGMVMIVSTGNVDQTTYTTAISPLAGYTYAMIDFYDVPERNAFYISMVVQAAIAVVAAISLVGKKRRGRAVIAKTSI